jgi:hypothetical protein
MITYAQYIDLGGRTVKSPDFPRIESRAADWVDFMTFGRGTKSGSLEAKRAVAAVCDILSAKEAGSDGGRIVQGYSNDGVSVSYTARGSGDGTVDPYDQMVKDAIVLKLANTGLLYRGIT